MRTLWAVVWLAFVGSQVAGQETPPDEGSVSRMTAAPDPFSPAFSPGKKDASDIGWEMTRELPVSLRVLAGTNVLRNLPPTDLERCHGWHNQRWVWNGANFAGHAMPDGLYDLEVIAHAQFNWRRGPLHHLPEGAIHQPGPIAVHPRSGQLYLAGSSRILDVFEPSGVFVRRVELVPEKGAPIHGAPCAMCFAPDGALLLLYRTGVFAATAEGRLSQIAPLPDKKTADWLDGLAVCPDGRILVCLRKPGEVLSFRRDGTGLDPLENISKPMDVAVSKDRIFVSMSGPEFAGVAILSMDGKVLKKVAATRSGGSLPMIAPGRMAVLGDGSVVLAESAGGPKGALPGMALFCRITPEGEVGRGWGSRGRGPGEVFFVSHLAGAGKEYYLSDHYGNHRILRCDAAGRVQKVIESPPGLLIAPCGLVKLTGDRFLTADPALSRCTVFDRQGNALRVFPLELGEGMAASDTPAGLGASLSGDVAWVVQGRDAVAWNAAGERVRSVVLETPAWAATTRPPGIWVAGDGRLVISVADPDLNPSPQMPDAGRLMVFDAAGKRTGHAGIEGASLYGPIFRQGRDRLVVQAWRKGTDRRGEFGVCEFQMSREGTLEPKKTVWLRPPAGFFPHVDGVFAPANGGYYKDGSSLGFFDTTGTLRWTLGKMQDKPFDPVALWAEGNELVVVQDKSGALESWRLEDQTLARGRVEVDNTPPAVAITGDAVWAVLENGLFVLRGSATDKNFDSYDVFYRVLTADPARRGSWQKVHPGRFNQPVTDGVLARWEVAPSWRDTGIEVRVVCLDKAGNSNEAVSRPITFDEDGDGWSNAEELAQGTDPREETRELSAENIEVRPEVEMLLRPYFSAHHAHELKFSAWDVRDPAKPMLVPGCTFTLFADAGSFAGGGLVPAGGGSTNDVGRATGLTSNQGLAPWTAPGVAYQEVALSAELVPRALGNALLPKARLDFTLEVRRDDDRDWAPDDTEAAVADAGPTVSLLDNPDSDGDQVQDGLDLAPRTACNGDDMWSATYAPGMIRYTQEMMFYGIGGGDSHVMKYGDKIKGDAILRSDRVDSSDRLAGYLNKVMFNREHSDPDKRSPLAVTGWMGFAATPPEKETEEIGTYKYEGGGHPTCTFVYYPRLARGTPVIENVDPVNGGTWGQGGLIRNYLKVSAPGALDEVDSKVVLQWKILNSNQTRNDTRNSIQTRMGWLVEVYDNPDLLGVHQMFSGLAMAEEAGAGLFQAELLIPSENLFRGVGLHLKLTPCWITRSGGERACPRCKWPRFPDEHEVCGVCGTSLERMKYNPIHRSSLSVSAVLVERDLGVIRFIRRLNTRASGPPVSDEELEKVIAAAPATVLAERAWPLCNHSMVRSVPAGERNLEVLFCSLRAINQLPTSLLPREVRAREKELTDYASTRLPAVEVVCLIANDQRKMQTLVEALAWGPPGAWYEIGSTPPIGEKPGAGESAPETAGGTTPPATGGGTGGSTLETLKKAAEDGKNIVMLFKEAHSLSSHHALWMPAQQAAKGPEWATTAIKMPSGDVGLDEVTGQRLTATRTLYLQKRDDGLFSVSSRTYVKRPTIEWTDTRTGIQITDARTTEGLVVTKSEKVADLNDSKLFKNEFDRVGASASKRSLVIAKLKPVLKVGAPVVTNGIKIYQCWTKGDKVGVAVYFLKGTTEVTQAVAEVRGVKGFLVNGLRVPGMMATKFNVVAAATGMLEAAYYLYKAGEAPNPIEQDIMAQKAAGAVIDAGIGAVEPYGAVILASWSVGGMLGNKISDLLGLGNNSLAAAVSESPGQALMALPRHWAPGTISPLLAKDAASSAQKDAIKKIEAKNSAFNTKLTWIWVPPEQ